MSNPTQATGQIALRAIAAEKGYKHLEAFCLMWYRCKMCGHMERLWNSRDGVTAFGIPCPSCGSDTMLHEFFGSDEHAPDHKPHFGQRVWVSMTLEHARKLARRNVLYRMKHSDAAEERIEQVAQSYFNGGQAPHLVIAGYDFPIEGFEL